MDSLNNSEWVVRNLLDTSCGLPDGQTVVDEALPSTLGPRDVTHSLANRFGLDAYSISAEHRKVKYCPLSPLSDISPREYRTVQ